MKKKETASVAVRVFPSTLKKLKDKMAKNREYHSLAELVDWLVKLSV